jgi:pimeloyl-ACP methyl ester carboxylesterase
MDIAAFHASRRFAEVKSGRIAYVERGNGPVAVFVHGVPLNGYHWRHVIDRVQHVRRCIAIDLMGLGCTEIEASQDVSFTAQAHMIAEVMDELGIETIDLVGNDSGGAIAQIFAARWPHRVRSLGLTNCDVYTNSPPALFQATVDAIRTMGGRQVCGALLSNPRLARSRRGFGLTYERPDDLSEETLGVYLGPLVATPERAALFERFVLSLAPRHTVEIAGALRRLEAPTLIAWGADDPFFELKWAYWLAGAIPGAGPVVEVEGARLFWPEERPAQLSDLLLEHWSTST